MLFCPSCGTKVIKLEEEVKQEVQQEVQEEVKAEVQEEVKQEVQEVKAEVQEEVKTEPENTEAAKDEKKKKKGLHPKPSAGVAILTFLLCLLAFVAGAAACISGALRLSYSGDKMAELMKALDIKETTFSTEAGSDGPTLVEFVENVSGFNFEKTAGFAKADLEKFMEEDFIRGTVTDILSDYVNYFFTGQKPKALTRDDVVEFVEEHDDDFFRLLEFRFTYMDPEKNKRVVYTVDIDNAFKDLGTDEVTADWLAKQAGVNFGLIVTGLSLGALIGLAAVGVILLILVLILQKKTAYYGISADGRTLLILGVILDVAALCGMFWLGARKSSIFYLFLSPLTKNLLVIGSAVLVVGLFFFVIGRAICNAKAKKNQ